MAKTEKKGLRLLPQNLVSRFFVALFPLSFLLFAIGWAGHGLITDRYGPQWCRRHGIQLSDDNDDPT